MFITIDKKNEEIKNYVSSVIFCRLGNNLFQIAAAVNLGLENNAIPIFENWKYSKYFDFDLVFDSDISQKIKWNMYIDKQFVYKKIKYSKNLKLHGIFQSSKYFEENIIKNIFKIKKEIKDYIYFKYNLLFNQKLTSIHVRRTDYIDFDLTVNLRINYYKNAINLLKNKTDKFVVFSDDIKWCKENLLFDNLVFIENEEDIIDLTFMSMCNNNIIANSTFSWWGAFLNNNKEKIIVAPKKWFNFKYKDYEYLIPKSWIKLGNFISF